MDIQAIRKFLESATNHRTNGKSSAERQPFVARGVCIGGIYPFNIKQITNLQLVKEKVKKSKLFHCDFPNQQTFANYKRLMYDPEQYWSNPSQVLFFETTVSKCVLSTGRSLEDIPFQAYLSIYTSGLVTILFWIELNEEEFSSDEIVEFTAIARGTTERINISRKVIIDVEWNHQLIEVSSLMEICKMLEKELRNTVLKVNSNGGLLVQFAHPIIYIQEIIGCSSATDIISRYSRDIAGIANLWIRKTQDLKREEVERIIKSDFHPFETGITCVSTGCTIELHPKITTSVLRREGLKFEEHHYMERFLLAFVCEALVAQYFILRSYDAKLSSMHVLKQKAHVSLLNPLYFLTLLYNAIQLTKFQRELMLAINEFRHIYLTRKPFYQHAISLYREAFATSSVEASIDKKLLSLQGHISTTYSMLTTIFALVLSIIATIFGVLQGIQALQTLGWLH